MVNFIKKLLRTWAWWAIAVATLPFFAFVAYSIDELAKYQRENLTVQLMAGAQSTANAVNQSLDISLAYLTVLAASDAAQNNNLPALYAHAQRVMEKFPQGSAISLVARDNSVVFMTLRPLGTQGLISNEVDALRAVFETGKNAVSGPFKAPISDKLITSINVPVFQKGKVAYCLRMVLLTSELSGLLIAQKLPDEWTLAIIAGNGSIVARSRSAELFVGKPASVEVQEAARTRKQTILDTRTLEGNAVKAAVVPLPAWNWAVGIAVPESTFNAPTYRLYWLLALFGFAIVVLGAIAANGLPKISMTKGQTSALSPSDTTLQGLSGVWPAVVALAFAIALSLAAAFVNQASLYRLQQLSDQRLSVSTQRLQVDELSSMFKDVAEGPRSDANPGQSTSLRSFNSASERILPLMLKLKVSMAQDGIEGFDWTELDEMAAGVLKNATHLDQGKLAMEKVQLQFAALEGLLAHRVDTLTAQLRQEGEKATHLQWLSVLAGGTLVSFSIGFWLLERQRRKRLYAELAAQHQMLESRVQLRTAELQKATEHIRNFSSESQRSIETERKRLSREVHDQIGQVFTGIKMIIKTLKPESLEKDQQAALDSALELGVKTTRRIAAELRPPLLDELGLYSALDLYLRANLSVAGLSYDIDIPHDHGLSGEQMTQLFRIAQEATTNTLRHARARHLTVTLHVTPVGWELNLDDDGQGWDPANDHANGLGVLGMQERAQMLGGHATLGRLDDGITRVSVLIPRAHAT